jgi:hypothetical protein
VARAVVLAIRETSLPASRFAIEDVQSPEIALELSIALRYSWSIDYTNKPSGINETWNAIAKRISIITSRGIHSCG